MIKLLKINNKAKIKYVLLMVAIFCNLAFLFYQIYYSKNNAEGLVLNVTGYPYSLVTDSDNMYFLEMDYSESDERMKTAIYQMRVDGKNPSVFMKSPSLEMKFDKLYIDGNGTLYAFLCDGQNDKVEIWKFIDGKKDFKKIDISPVLEISDISGVVSFLVDCQGRFYLREYMGEETIVLNENGSELCRIPDDDRYYHCMGIARNGQVYALFEMESSYVGLSRLNIEEGSLESIKVFLPNDDIYSRIQSGNDCDFIIQGVKKSYTYTFAQNSLTELGDTFKISNFKYNAVTTSFLNDKTLIVIAENQNMEQKINYGDIRLYRCLY